MSNLPRHTHRLFWDVDPTTLDVDAYPRYVVERLLELGDLEAVRWLLARFSRQEIVDVLQSSRRLSPRSASFWAMYLGVDKESVRCLSTPSRQEQEPIWRD